MADELSSHPKALFTLSKQCYNYLPFVDFPLFSIVSLRIPLNRSQQWFTHFFRDSDMITVCSVVWYNVLSRKKEKISYSPYKMMVPLVLKLLLSGYKVSLVY